MAGGTFARDRNPAHGANLPPKPPVHLRARRPERSRIAPNPEERYGRRRRLGSERPCRRSRSAAPGAAARAPTRSRGSSALAAKEARPRRVAACNRPQEAPARRRPAAPGTLAPPLHWRAIFPGAQSTPMSSACRMAAGSVATRPLASRETSVVDTSTRRSCFSACEIE